MELVRRVINSAIVVSKTFDIVKEKKTKKPEQTMSDDA